MASGKWTACLLSAALIYSGFAIGATESILVPIWFEFVARLGSKPSIRRLILMSFYWTGKFSNNLFGRIYLRTSRHTIAPILFLIIATSIFVINKANLFQFGVLAALATIAYGGFYGTAVLWLADLHGEDANPYLHIQNLLWFLGRTLPFIIFVRPHESKPETVLQNSTGRGSSKSSAKFLNYAIPNNPQRSTIEDIVYPNKSDFHLVENYSVIFGALISLAFVLHFVYYINFAILAKKRKVIIDEYEEDAISNFPVIKFLLGVLAVTPTLNWARNGANLLLKFAIHSNAFAKTEETFLLEVYLGSFTVGSIIGVILCKIFESEWMLRGNVFFIIFGNVVFLLANYFPEPRMLVEAGVVILGMGISTCVPNVLYHVLCNLKMSPFAGAIFYSMSGVSAHGLNIFQSYFIKTYPNVFVHSNFFCSALCLVFLYLFTCKR